MQVAHVNDHITHAVIGGGEAINFGISNSPEFFNILSSTLYKDQILAVVREVLCNAWDAHIECGKTHIPVEITLTEDTFTIKDFGTGIHRDDIGPIYGVYGASTKKNDGKQTGGFGLGCKAPFAYTDHFEVISNHEGVKTIYNMSKSSAQAQGLPGIVPIASFPTQDTGLQVKIHINNRTDRDKFHALVHRIVKNGDMNMTLNGYKLETLGFDTTKANYLVTPDTTILSPAPYVMVRYGNVIYPVDAVNELYAEYTKITKYLDNLTNQRNSYRIVFQAPPHSISVTPSRESLSMQEKTIKTLKGLLKDFLKMYDAGFQGHCDVLAIDTVQAAVNKRNLNALLTREMKLPELQFTAGAGNIADLVSMAKCYLQHNYPEGTAFRCKDIRWRMEAMSKAGVLNRGLVQTFLRELDTITGVHAKSDWLQRQVIAPLLTKMYAAGIDHTNLYGYDSGDNNAPDDYYRKGIAPLVRATSISPRHLFDGLTYLRNIVVVSTSRSQIKERAMLRDEFKELGKYQGYLFYHASMKVKERNDAIEFFKAAGMVVIDLTTKLRVEIEAQIQKASYAVPRKPVKKGLVGLLAIKGKGDGTIDTELSRRDDAVRIIAPEFVAAISIRQGEANDTIGKWSALGTASIINLFGAVGGATNNSAMHKKWVEQGTKDVNDYVREKVLDFMKTNPKVQEYWPFNPKRALAKAGVYRGSTVQLTETAYRNPLFRKYMGLVNNLDDTEMLYVQLWHELASGYSNEHPDVTKLNHKLNKLALDPINLHVVDRLQNSPLMPAFSADWLNSLMRSLKPDTPKNEATVSMLVLALSQ